MTAEEWKSVPDFPDYAVSSLGRVISMHRWRGQAGRELVGSVVNGMYQSVQLCGPQGKRRRLVHLLVAEAFLGPRPADMPQTRHLDGDPSNNAAQNLRYGTASENAYDRVRHGTHNMASKTHCPQNHPYDETNTYTAPDRTNRTCRVCRAVNARASKQRAAFRAAGIKAA